MTGKGVCVVLNLAEILAEATREKASDIHLVPGHPPIFRIHTNLGPSTRWGNIAPDETADMLKALVGEHRFASMETHMDLDFSAQIEGVGRFRVNAHYQRDSIAMAFRAIPSKVPALENLNLPPAIHGFVDLPRGLVLVTGPTGSGKSTTLASLIDAMNHRESSHIITLEDPVEYQLSSDKSLIEQREVGANVTSFASGLKHALRQDPDVILVGEMRDLETISAAITAAETGHLVLSTVHTQSAAQTVERIVDVYPSEQQNQVRSMLSNTLQAVVTQTLFKRIDAPGVVPACEVMICNSAIRNCIRENRIHEIPSVIETNRNQGMCLLDDSIKALYLNGRIDRDQALSQAAKPLAMAKALSA